jgi:hypothetical protein
MQQDKSFKEKLQREIKNDIEEQKARNNARGFNLSKEDMRNYLKEQIELFHANNGKITKLISNKQYLPSVREIEEEEKKKDLQRIVENYKIDR